MRNNQLSMSVRKVFCCLLSLSSMFNDRQIQAMAQAVVLAARLVPYVAKGLSLWVASQIIEEQKHNNF